MALPGCLHRQFMHVFLCIILQPVRLLHDDLPLHFHIASIKTGVKRHIEDDIYSQGKVFIQKPRIKASIFTVGIAVEMAADIVYLC